MHLKVNLSTLFLGELLRLLPRPLVGAKTWGLLLLLILRGLRLEGLLLSPHGSLVG